MVPFLDDKSDESQTTVTDFDLCTLVETVVKMERSMKSAQGCMKILFTK